MTVGARWSGEAETPNKRGLLAAGEEVSSLKLKVIIFLGGHSRRIKALQYFLHSYNIIHLLEEEGFIQKRRLRSPLLFGGRNLECCTSLIG